MRCVICNNNSPLWIADGGCNVCSCQEMPVKAPSKPVKAINGVKVGHKPSAPSKLSKAQLQETLDLKSECQCFMEASGIKFAPFVKMLGLNKSMMYKWWNSGVCLKFQPQYNKKVRIALDEYASCITQKK